MQTQFRGYAFLADRISGELVLHLVADTEEQIQIIPFHGLSNEVAGELKRKWWWLQAECDRAFPSHAELLRQKHDLLEMRAQMNVLESLLRKNTGSDTEPLENTDQASEDRAPILISLFAWLQEMRKRLIQTHGVLGALNTAQDCPIAKAAVTCSQSLVGIRELVEFAMVDTGMLLSKIHVEEPTAAAPTEELAELVETLDPITSPSSQSDVGSPDGSDGSDALGGETLVSDEDVPGADFDWYTQLIDVS